MNALEQHAHVLLSIRLVAMGQRSRCRLRVVNAMSIAFKSHLVVPGIGPGGRPSRTHLPNP